MFEELSNLLVGFTDWYLAGRFLGDADSKAAMGVLNYALWLIPSLFTSVGVGAAAIVARSIGAGNTRGATHATNQALLAGTVLALLACLAVWYGAGPFAQLMQLEGAAAALTARYLQIVSWSLVPLMIEQVGLACLRAAGDTWSSFAVKLAVNVCDIVFSALLVTGWGPFPKLGWDGLAIGTALGHCIAAALLLLLLARGRAGLRLSWRDLFPDLPLLRRIARIGLPGGCDQLAIIACHMTFAATINTLGTVAAAAHGLALQIESLSYLPGSAFQIAAATTAGQALGARDPQGATRSVQRAWLAGLCVMTTAGILFFFGGDLLTRFFNGGATDDVTQLATSLLKILLIACPFHCTLMILSGALRGAGDTRWPLAITFIGLLGIRLPSAVLLAWDHISLPILGWELSGCGWGVHGAWYAMVIDNAVRAALLYVRFARGKWRSVHV
jgi:putative MATE family efflux protein